MNNYSEIANEARKTVLRLIFKAQSSHLGSNFSVIDLMTVLFEHIDLSRDKVILSAGWKAASLYYFLYRKGKITEEELNSYCMDGSKFIGLTEPIIPEIPFSGGSMGMGLPAGVGFALAKKMNKEEGKIYVIMSDGEQAIGTTHEAALIAAHHKLDNLVVIVDNNKFQAMGETRNVLNIEPLDHKWKAYGWSVQGVNGHNYDAIEKVLKRAWQKRPEVIIADTVKGKGVPFLEGDNVWHYKAPSEDEYNKALQCLK